MIIGINPYLFFNGQAQEAIKFYEETLEATVLAIQTFGQLPENPEFPLPVEAKDYVLHAHLKIGGTDLMISDSLPGGPHSEEIQIGTNVTIAVSLSAAEEAEQVFNRLQEGGQITMPLQKTFFSPAYGQITDKFGVSWHVSTHVEQ